MKVRIGLALGGQGMLRLEDFDGVLDRLEALGFDSVWLPETFLAGTIDPLVGLAYAAARARRLKIGTHIVGPGRNPISLAKSLAQLDRLSKGRLLLVFVAGLGDASERAAQGMTEGDRTQWFDEQLPRLRQWWGGEAVDGLMLDSRPIQDPLEVWLGGQATKALERVGRLGDGWIPGRITRHEAVAARTVIERAASEAGRVISGEHFGINLTYGWDADAMIPPIRGTGDASDVVSLGAVALRENVQRWIEVGFTKIVARPLRPPADWAAELDRLAETVLDLQT